MVLLSAYVGAFVIVHRSGDLRKPAANMAYWYYSDNPVIEDIELGLFMGALGRERSFIVKPRGEDIKVPSDLLGLKPLEYSNGTTDTVSARVAPICNEIRNTVRTLGPK